MTGDTRIWVEDRGLVPIVELVGTTPRVATFDGERVVFREASQVISTGRRAVYRLSTVEGVELRLTGEHLVATDGGDIPAESLRAGTKLRSAAKLVGDREWLTVADLELEGEADVFDLTEPTTSHFFANGLLVHNCGEQPLLPFESCTLGSIDVGKFVSRGDLEWSRLQTTIHAAVRFLDDVIDANRYPLAEIERATKETRKIGLGIMGWADALAALGIAYDSEQALALGDRLATFLEVESLQPSRELATRHGRSQ